MHDCPTCQDGREVADQQTGELISCPDCCYDAQAHDCAQHPVEKEDRPAHDGSHMTWTECRICGFVLTKPQLQGGSSWPISSHSRAL